MPAINVAVIVGETEQMWSVLAAGFTAVGLFLPLFWRFESLQSKALKARSMVHGTAASSAWAMDDSLPPLRGERLQPVLGVWPGPWTKG